MTDATRERMKLVLSSAAYVTGRVRIADDDLRTYSHLVATRAGLYAINLAGHKLVAYGLFYGIAIDGGAIYVFEACASPYPPVLRGRIVRLALHGERIVDAEVFATGLSTSCHQIDVIDDRLCVVDTFNQVVRRYSMDGRTHDFVDPLPLATHPYAHVNSLLATDDRIILLLHNHGQERPSELAILDRLWRLVERRTLDAHGCHNIARLEDGTFLTCTDAGLLVGTDGRRVKVTQMMARGLSVDANTIVVGGSPRRPREGRISSGGTVTFLDRDGRIRASIGLPGAPTEIRRIDGRDLAQSAFVSRELPHR